MEKGSGTFCRCGGEHPTSFSSHREMFRENEQPDVVQQSHQVGAVDLVSPRASDFISVLADLATCRLWALNASREAFVAASAFGARLAPSPSSSWTVSIPSHPAQWAGSELARGEPKKLESLIAGALPPCRHPPRRSGRRDPRMARDFQFRRQSGVGRQGTWHGGHAQNQFAVPRVAQPVGQAAGPQDRRLDVLRIARFGEELVGHFTVRITASRSQCPESTIRTVAGDRLLTCSRNSAVHARHAHVAHHDVERQRPSAAGGPPALATNSVSHSCRMQRSMAAKRPERAVRHRQTIFFHPRLPPIVASGFWVGKLLADHAEFREGVEEGGMYLRIK